MIIKYRLKVAGLFSLIKKKKLIVALNFSQKIFFILIFFTLSIANAEIKLREYNGRYCYDGDTCYVIVNKIHEKVRLLELDTPEISKPKCKAELLLGLEARDYLNNLIRNASTIEIRTDYVRDYFGRILAHLIIDGEDVSSNIVSNNLGVVYNRNNRKDWCSK